MSAKMNSYIRMDRILLYFLCKIISIVSPFLFTYGLNRLLKKPPFKSRDAVIIARFKTMWVG